MNIKKLSLGLLSVTFSLLLMFTVSTKIANAGSSELKGWGWSSNIGHISLNCSNLNSCATSDYKVVVATTTNTEGTMTGYAWSSNIGWIKFAGDATHPGPTINLDTGAIEGWIRACAGTVNKDCTGADRTDGWDGWMKLSEPGSIYPTGRSDGTGGLSYDKTRGYIVGYVWGGMLGWITFNSTLAPYQGVVCPGCVTTNSGNLTAVCQFSSPLIVPSSSPTTTITPTIGSYSGGTAPYTYSKGGSDPFTSSIPSFTVGVGTHSLLVSVKDNSVPQKIAVLSCPVTVQLDTAASGLRMWIKPAALTAVDDQSLAAIRVKVGQDVNLNWESAASIGGCSGYLNDITQVSGVSSKPSGQYLTISNLAKGVYKYKMLCINTLDFSDMVGTASNGKDYLLITVGDSKVIEQ